MPEKNTDGTVKGQKPGNANTEQQREAQRTRDAIRETEKQERDADGKR